MTAVKLQRKPTRQRPNHDILDAATIPYVDYHDTEGGPVHDDRALFEKLVLDGFQAGLSWITILRRRDGIIPMLDGFEPKRIAVYAPRCVEALLQDTRITRNRQKVAAAVRNAPVWMTVMEGSDGFSSLLWKHVGNELIVNQWERTRAIPTQTKESRAMAREFKSLGFGFCGPYFVLADLTCELEDQPHQIIIPAATVWLVISSTRMKLPVFRLSL